MTQSLRRCIFEAIGSNLVTQVSNEKNLGCLFDIGDYTTQLYGNFNKQL